MLRADEVRQPKWYLLAKAASWLNCTPWALDALPEYDKEFWLRAALVGSNAEQEAQRINSTQDT